jgi:hypothetical protein
VGALKVARNERCKFGSSGLGIDTAFHGLGSLLESGTKSNNSKKRLCLRLALEDRAWRVLHRFHHASYKRLAKLPARHFAFSIPAENKPLDGLISIDLLLSLV